MPFTLILRPANSAAKVRKLIMDLRNPSSVTPSLVPQLLDGFLADFKRIQTKHKRNGASKALAR
jgi:hypothetical protein